MNTAKCGPGGGSALAAIRSRAERLARLAAGLLDRPLDYILADHERQRSVCAVLGELRLQPVVSHEEADQVVAFLRQDLPLHHADEDEGLFPALRRRALPEDELDAVLSRMGEDHRRGEELVAEIISALSPAGASHMIVPSVEARRLFEAYAEFEYRHLAYENAVVMVIARVRLHRIDLVVLSEAMKCRRGMNAR